MHIIDRRLNPKGKNLGNVQRFFTRIKSDLVKAIDEDIKGGSVKDSVTDGTVTTKNRISVTQSSIHEPSFRFDSKAGKFSFILPGNKNFQEDDYV